MKAPKPMSVEEAEMNAIAAAVTTLIVRRPAALSKDGAVIAALIGAFSVIRIDDLNEEALLREVRKACPTILGASSVH